MAKLCQSDFCYFNSYHHTYIIKITDTNKESSLEFIEEYFNSGERYANNQPGVSGNTLDKKYGNSKSIYHYFCNRDFHITGVTGGLMYEYNDVYLYIGFSNPLLGFLGWRKGFIKLSTERMSAKYPYDNLENGYDHESTCNGWKVSSRFAASANPMLIVTLEKDD